MPNKIRLLVLLCIAFSTICNAQKLPIYSQFQAKVEKKTAKKVNLESHSEAKFFRTNLKKALATSEVNFAGKYILTQWGCGTACIQAGIIDAQTGTIYLPVILQSVTQGYNPIYEDHEILEFKKNSKLLIIYGVAGYDKKENQEGISYYEWTGKDVKLLKFINVK